VRGKDRGSRVGGVLKDLEFVSGGARVQVRKWARVLRRRVGNNNVLHAISYVLWVLWINHVWSCLSWLIQVSRKAPSAVRFWRFGVMGEGLSLASQLSGLVYVMAA
jgi:hypothetical protein